ncbi:tauropine dehydrogenase-like isoform X3 [Lineus longissimus]
MEGGTFCVDIIGGGARGEDVAIHVDPFKVSKDPKLVIPGAHIIVFVVPSFAHEQYFEAIAPFVCPQSVIIGLPGGNGFEFQLRGILKEKADLCTVMVFESLPWACRIKEFGKVVELLATKESLDGALQRPNTGAIHHNHLASFQYMLGDLPRLQIKGHLLGITLMSPNCIVHPIIMYGEWVNWDGQPRETAPLFYWGVTQETGDLMSNCSQEILAISQKIMDLVPGVNLTNVKHIYDWFIIIYGSEISDKTSLATVLRTNKGYNGLTHPCVKTDDGKFLPNFKYRYMTEDISFGLAVVKGIADILGVDTPSIDKVLYWAQGILNKEYVVNGRLVGNDVGETRAPQRYGLITLKDILNQEV